jgi:hypothetical protein
MDVNPDFGSRAAGRQPPLLMLVVVRLMLPFKKLVR